MASQNKQYGGLMEVNQDEIGRKTDIKQVFFIKKIQNSIYVMQVLRVTKKYKNINKPQTVKKLENRKRRLQPSISRKYEKNKIGGKY